MEASSSTNTCSSPLSHFSQGHLSTTCVGHSILHSFGAKGKRRTTKNFSGHQDGDLSPSFCTTEKLLLSTSTLQTAVIIKASLLQGRKNEPASPIQLPLPQSEESDSEDHLEQWSHFLSLSLAYCSPRTSLGCNCFNQLLSTEYGAIKESHCSSLPSLHRQSPGPVALCRQPFTARLLCCRL